MKSLRLKILVAAGVTVVIVQLLLSAFQISSDRRVLLQKFAATTSMITSELSQSLTGPLWNFELENARSLIALKLKNPEFVGIEVKSLENDKEILCQIKRNDTTVATTDHLEKSNLITEEQNISYDGEERWRFIFYFSDSDLEKRIRNMVWYSIFSALIGSTVLIIMLYVFLTVLLIAPLKTINNYMQDVAEGDGDLTKRLPVSGKNLEIDTLSTNFNRFVKKIQELINLIAENAETVAKAAASLSGISGNISDNAGRMSSETESVSSTAVSASQTIGNISHSASEMSTSSDSIAAAVEEMSASLSEVASNCQKELEVAMDAAQHAHASREIMDSLDTEASSIGKIIEMINDIADQTNLLALNATIEAASAGDMGRGFAVVAEEVKELAKQTSSATQSIESQVQEMQKNSRLAVSGIANVAGVIDEVKNISQVIASAVEEQSSTINEISNSISYMNTNVRSVAGEVEVSSKGLTEIADSIKKVNSSVGATSEEIGGLNKSSQDLAGLAENLKRLVQQFRF